MGSNYWNAIRGDMLRDFIWQSDTSYRTTKNTIHCTLHSFKKKTTKIQHSTCRTVLVLNRKQYDNYFQTEKKGQSTLYRPMKFIYLSSIQTQCYCGGGGRHWWQGNSFYVLTCHTGIHSTHISTILLCVSNNNFRMCQHLSTAVDIRILRGNGHSGEDNIKTGPKTTAYVGYNFRLGELTNI
jgi:hypothetical protein